MRQDIKERVFSIIKERKAQLEKEIKGWERKMRDTEWSYGCGGPYHRQEEAKEKRQKELRELEEFELQVIRTVKVEKIDVHLLYCRNCSNVFMSAYRPGGEWHECPACRKMVYDNNPVRQTLEVKDNGDGWLKAFKAEKQNESDDE